DASYMPELVARAIIESCAQMRARDVAPPVKFAGAPDSEAFAQRLAWYILEDVVLYHGEDDAVGLQAAVEEARALFAERVEARLLPIFEERFAKLDARLQGKAVHQPWLRDIASARSVGSRWAAMLPLLPESERELMRARGMRWFAMWAPDSAV